MSLGCKNWCELGEQPWEAPGYGCDGLWSQRQEPRGPAARFSGCRGWALRLQWVQAAPSWRVQPLPEAAVVSKTRTICVTRTTCVTFFGMICVTGTIRVTSTTYVPGASREPVQAERDRMSRPILNQSARLIPMGCAYSLRLPNPKSRAMAGIPGGSVR